MPSQELWFFLLFAAFMISFGVAGLPGCAQSAPPQSADPASVGRALCTLLDLSTPGLEQVKQAADSGDYAVALNDWRDYQVEKLRRSPLGIMPYHGYRLSPYWLAAADRLTGKITQDQYTANSTKVAFYDIYGMSGDPNAPQSPINWLAVSSNPRIEEKTDYSTFYFADSLAADYWKTGDPDYLKKWFEIASDFALNQKRMIETVGPLWTSQMNVPTFVANWQGRAAGSALAQGDRVQSLITCLAVFAKSLPEGGKPAKWDDIGAPVDSALPPNGIALIPAAQLAEIAISLTQDHPQALEERYLKESGVPPNQRRNGLDALLQIAVQFDEFKDASAIGEQASSSLSEYFDSDIAPDGGMLEQSFNYNLNDARELVALLPIIQTKYPALATQLTGKIALFNRCQAALSMPTGGMPMVGNSHEETPPKVWEDTDTNAQALARASGVGLSTDPLAPLLAAGEEQPAFTSIAFPYSGYYAMRRDWKWDSPYLFFMTARPARGHKEMSTNAIQVEAYGRPMLVDGGAPPYAPSFLSDEFRNDFQSIYDYLGEESTWKTNTITMDGHSQSHAAPAASHVYPTTAPVPWLTTPHFDYLENLYDLGYGDPYSPKPGLKIDKSVAHERQVLFVKDANLWIVTDHMINKTPGVSHAFTQIWNIAPRIDDPKHPVFGYTNDQVVLDQAAREFYTDDPSGPNIHLYSFGAPGLTYEKIYAQKNPYRGWFARGIGDLQPMTTVDADWTSDQSTLVATIIAPGRDASAPLESVSDHTPKGDVNQVGFTAHLPDGGTLTYFCTAIPQWFKVDDIGADAKTLLVEHIDGATRGIALGCTSLGDGKQSLTPAEPDFVWQKMPDGTIQITAPIRIPQGFAWEKTADGLMPSYASATP